MKNIGTTIWNGIRVAAQFGGAFVWSLLCALPGIVWSALTAIVFVVAGFTKTGRRVTRNVTTGRAAARMMKGKGPL